MSARRVLVLTTLAALAALSFRPSAAAPLPTGEKPASLAGSEVEVRFIDGSTMKVKLLDEKLELVTKHGTLQIAVADVRGIELATRIPPADADKARAAALALGSPEHKVRDQATADLKAIGPRAFGAILKAAESEDPEVAQRAEELIAFMKGKYSEGRLEVRDKDVVQTEDSKIAGTLSAASLRISTFQFGELRMKLADVQSIGDTGEEDDRLAANAPAAPTSLTAYANQFGKVLTFKVTGPVVQPGFGPQGSVWGSDQYTLDSYFAMAALHAGVVQPGQTAVVRVKIVQPPNQFASSTRNGVTSNPYGAFPAGAFEFVVKKKK